ADHAGCAAAGVGCQPGIGGSAGGRAGGGVIGSFRGANASQHLLELQAHGIVRAQCTDAVRVLDGLVVQADAQILDALIGEAEVLDGGGFRLQVRVAGTTGGTTVQSAAGDGALAKEDLTTALVRV